MRLLVLKTILVATDLDDSSLAAIAAGRALAAAADAELHVVNVSASSTPPDGAAVHALLERAGVGLNEASVHAVAGDPTLAIGRLADAISADVIVLGPHHQDGGAALAGTVLGIVTNSAAPCLVANTLNLPIARVVVAVDLSETSRGALVVGLSWASALRGNRSRSQPVNLTALYVTKRDASTDELYALARALERQVDDLRDEAGSWANVVVESDVIRAERVDEAVARYATEHGAGLIVLGTRGLGLDTIGRVGSVAASVAGMSTVPSLLVPPAIWLELGRVRPRRQARTGALRRAG